MASHNSRYHPKIKRKTRHHPYNSTNENVKIPPKKPYKCSQCSERFDTLTDLYKHKQLKHPPIVLVNNYNHDHDESFHNDPIAEIPLPASDGEVSEHLKPPPKRRLEETDNESDISTDLIPAPDSNTDNESDISTDLTPAPESKKRLRDDNTDLKPSSKKKRDNDRPPIDPTRKTIYSKYKKLYRECLSTAEKWKSLYVKLRSENTKLQEEYEKAARTMGEANMELKSRLEECTEVVLQLQDRVVKQQAGIDSLKEERKELRVKYEKSINHIQQLEEDGQLDAFNDISKSIFNCVSIEQIERVRKLFKKKDFAKIRQPNNIEVLQRIIQGINRGYIPICNPQQSRMTDAHQILLDDMDKASSEQLKKIIGTNSKLLSELMYTVDDSVKMIVHLYNKFGSQHDESDTGTSSSYGSDSIDDNSDSANSL